MKPSYLFLDDDVQMAFGSAVGGKMSQCVESVEMENENSRGRRWVAVECRILNERFSGLTEQELGWVAEGMLKDLLVKAYGGYFFSVYAKVHCYSEKAFRIYYFAEVFE